jgi:hypothetical protein
MKKIILIFLLLSTCLYSQEFKHSGFVYDSNGTGIANIPVNLFGRRTDPYAITFPTYPSGLSFNTGTVVPSSDDVTHGPFNIGFTFNFFGNNYTQFYIGSNGWIGFSPGQTTGYTAQFIPNAGSPRNVIMADWEDLFPGAANIYYRTTGLAPNRQLIVSFNAVPHYGCRTTLFTFQIILNETTNIIDINYAAKPLCGVNNATAGLVNIDNTNVVPVGGKNASLWSVTNYSVRFIPASAETSFSLKSTHITDTTGRYVINSGLDVQSFQFELRIGDLSVGNPTQSDISSMTSFILNQNPFSSKTYYLFDVNQNTQVSVSDIFTTYSKMNGRFAAWPYTPNYRIMTPAQHSTILSSTTDLRNTIPGTSLLTISSPANNGSTNFYIYRTGFKQ